MVGVDWFLAKDCQSTGSGVTTLKGLRKEQRGHSMGVKRPIQELELEDRSPDDVKEQLDY